MSLRAWQSALLRMLPDPEATETTLARQAAQLTCNEKDNLKRIAQSAGFEVTRDVQIWWRQARLKIAIPFTMRLIERLELLNLLEQYQKGPCTTLFFLREAQAFSAFIQNNSQAPAIVRDMVRFECALHLARVQQSNAGSTKYSEDDFAEQELSLTYHPEDCLAALLQNTPLPNSRPEKVTIQFDSRWPRLWRSA